MFRLKATLVPMTVLRPWRTGWSVERGVDFSFAAAVRPSAATAAPREDVVAAERSCFIDEDWATPTGAAVVRQFESLANEAAPDPAIEDAAEAAGMRAWWSLASKPSRT